MKPNHLPSFGIGDRIRLGRYEFLVFEIVYQGGGEWRYRGNMYKDGGFWNVSNVSERVLSRGKRVINEGKDVQPIPKTN